jgi:hypothetical protein
MDPRVAVAVGDVEVAARRQSGMGAAVERLAAHIRLGLAGDAEGHQHFAVERAFAHRVIAVVGQPDRIVRAHMDAVGPVEHPFAPGAQQIALGIEDRDRMLAAIEGVDPVLAVDADRRTVTQRDFLRHLRPILVDLEGVLAASELNRHASSPSSLR